MNKGILRQLADHVIELEHEDFVDQCTEHLEHDDCEIVHDWIGRGGFSIPKNVRDIVKGCSALKQHPYYLACLVLADLSS